MAEEGRSIGSYCMDDCVKSHYSPNCTMVLLASVRRVTSIESSTIVKL